MLPADSPFVRRVDYYTALAAAEEADRNPDIDVIARLGAWSRVQSSRTDLSLYEQGNAFAALELAEGVR